MLDKAFHVAKSGVPGPVFVELPIDTLYPVDVIRDEVLKPYKNKTDWMSRLTKMYINHYVDRLSAGASPARHSKPIPVVEMRAKVRSPLV